MTWITAGRPGRRVNNWGVILCNDAWRLREVFVCWLGVWGEVSWQFLGWGSISAGQGWQDQQSSYCNSIGLKSCALRPHSGVALKVKSYIIIQGLPPTHSQHIATIHPPRTRQEHTSSHGTPARVPLYIASVVWAHHMSLGTLHTKFMVESKLWCSFHAMWWRYKKAWQCSPQWLRWHIDWTLTGVWKAHAVSNG